MQGSNLPRLEFSSNWNFKLLCDIFPTVRLENPAKYRVGQIYNCYLKKQFIGRVQLIKINRIAFHKISDEMAFVDTGKESASYLKTLLQNFYPKANFSTQKINWLWFKHLDNEKTKETIKTQIVETERVGPHYFRDHITIDGIDIHYTPEGIKFYHEHYTQMLNHYEAGQREYQFITEILQRIDLHQHLYNQIFNT